MHRCLLLGHVQSRHGLRVTVFGHWNGSECVNTGWGRFAFEQLVEHVNLFIFYLFIYFLLYFSHDLAETQKKKKKK